jgi:hypothetical protein
MEFNDRREKNDAKMAKDMLKGATSNRPAPCGHNDLLGYLTNTPCLSCTKKNHKKAMGK